MIALLWLLAALWVLATIAVVLVVAATYGREITDFDRECARIDAELDRRGL